MAFQDFFCKFYAKNHHYPVLLKKIKLPKVEKWVCKKLANMLIPFYFNHSMVGKDNKSIKIGSQASHKKIIVSLTSFPNRLPKIWITIESILRQTLRPDKVILWLSKEQIANIDSLPKNLKDLQKRGVEIRLVSKDLKSYKKYFYCIQEFKDEIVVLIDDDIIYNSTMLEDMYKQYEQNTIVCRYGFIITYTNGIIDPYLKWTRLHYGTTIENKNIFFGTGGGTMFCPKEIYEDIDKEELFLQLAPTADDIWFNSMVRLNDLNIKLTSSGYLIPVTIKNNKTLAAVNLSQNQNDLQIQKVRSYYLEKTNKDPFSERFPNNK